MVNVNICYMNIGSFSLYWKYHSTQQNEVDLKIDLSINEFNARVVGTVQFRKIFELKVAESSETAVKLWKNSSLEIAKLGAI